jgi:hypothetical protein
VPNRKEITRREPRIADAPACALRHEAYPVIPVPRALRQRAIGGIAPVLGEKDATNERRVGCRQGAGLRGECGRERRERDEDDCVDRTLHSANDVGKTYLLAKW